MQTVAVRPSQADPSAGVQVRINGGAFTPVAWRAASPALPLNPGNNVVEVKVTAFNGVTTKSYTLAVNRGRALCKQCDPHGAYDQRRAA